MKPFFKNLFTSSSKNEQAIIAEIHNAFDTAQDKLLKQAKDILSTLSPIPFMKAEEKATRLQKLGFIGTPSVQQSLEIKEKRKNVENKIVTTTADAELIQYYKSTYPFLKFLTENELDAICRKYNLIYAPVQHFIKEVPEKNLHEIENTQSLRDEDILADYFVVQILSFWRDCPKEIQALLKKEIRYTGYISKTDDQPSDKDVLKALKDIGYLGNYTGYIFERAVVKKIDKGGLFICAPPSHFDLKGLEKDGELGYFKIQTWEINDPIVFRYCKGGIQVISKWGLEASDPALVNEINN